MFSMVTPRTSEAVKLNGESSDALPIREQHRRRHASFRMIVETGAAKDHFEPVPSPATQSTDSQS